VTASVIGLVDDGDLPLLAGIRAAPTLLVCRTHRVAVLGAARLLAGTSADEQPVRDPRGHSGGHPDLQRRDDSDLPP
jgi:hypothetical protein